MLEDKRFAPQHLDERPDFESFKVDQDACAAHGNAKRRPVKPKGLTPEEFRNQSLAA